MERHRVSSQQNDTRYGESATQRGKTFLRRLFKGFEEAQQQRTNDGSRHQLEPNPYLEHTGWDVHIGGFKRWAVRIIRASSKEENVAEEDSRGQQEDEQEGGRERREPVEEEEDTKSERALEEAYKATVALIRRSFKAVRVEIVGRPTMEYINRRETGASNNDRPFYGKQKIVMFDHELKDREWMPAIDYTPILAAIITTLRAIVIRRAWRIRQESIRTMMRSGTSEDAAREQAPGVLAGVQEMVHRFMTLTTFGCKPTPLNRIFQQKTYSMRIRYATKAEGQIWWEGDDTVLVRKIKFSMNDIRTVAHGLNSTVQRRLVEDLLLFEGIERSNANEWRPAGVPRFDLSKAVEGYSRKVKKFKEELIVLVHITAGAPARSTELISIQRQNGKDARSHRGVFVDNGLVAFVTAYHKRFSASQSMRIIHRFAPSERHFGSWLWEPAPEEEWPEADEEEEEENEDKGDKSDKERRPAEEDGPGWDGLEGEEEEEEEEVAGQRKPDPKPTNSDRFWDTNRVRRAIQRETVDRIGVASGIGDWRQVYPAIHREFATNREIREMLDKTYENRKSSDKRQDEQAGIAAI
ncbi:hypothetical protein LTR28_005546 [Elasticomyces elasticus]|nr:hypothetical protein LTR28_005546 [Elasticomyces elasticus]